LKIGVIIFGSVRFLSKKVTKPKLFFLKKKPKPNRNRVKPTGFGSVQFFRVKTGSNRFGSVFPVLLGFFGLARFFFLIFCRFRFGSVWFFWFFVYKTEPAGFFKNLIGFFFGSVFSVFFFRFSRFSSFLLTPNWRCQGWSQNKLRSTTLIQDLPCLWRTN